MQKSVDSYKVSGQRLSVLAVGVSVFLGTVKLVAGLLGNSYALVADAIESFADTISSVIVWGSLRLSQQPPSERHPYGFGRAESLAALVVSALLVIAGVGIIIEAISEIRRPHHAPAPFTLIVLVGVVIIKEVLHRYVKRLAIDSDSDVLHADAWHHRADALTSVASFIGISVSLMGGPGWEMGDDIAAIFAALIIIWNGISVGRSPLRDILDAQPELVTDEIRAIASQVDEVEYVQKVYARRSGNMYWVDMHVWVHPDMSVRKSHDIAHTIKDRVKAALPNVGDVLIHIEPAK